MAFIPIEQSNLSSELSILKSASFVVFKPFELMNICFIMYPWEEIVPDADSSICLIHECALRGHQVAITTESNLTIRDSIPLAFAKVLQKSDKISKTKGNFHKQAKFKDQMLPLAGFDVIFMRANPPLDNFVLNFLDSVKEDVFIVNNVDGLREANNKLYTAAFYDPTNEIIPRTFVSKNKEYLKSVIEESDADRMIMKPLKRNLKPHLKGIPSD